MCVDFKYLSLFTVLSSFASSDFVMADIWPNYMLIPRVNNELNGRRDGLHAFKLFAFLIIRSKRTSFLGNSKRFIFNGRTLTLKYIEVLHDSFFP